MLLRRSEDRTMYTEHLYKNSLCHHGIQGQRWGVRRFQNPDGSLTPEGKARYNKNLETAKQHIDDAQELRKQLKEYEEGGKDLKENGYWSDHYAELCRVAYNTIVDELNANNVKWTDDDLDEIYYKVAEWPVEDYLKLNDRAIKQIKAEIKTSENAARDLLKENERLANKKRY